MKLPVNDRIAPPPDGFIGARERSPSPLAFDIPCFCCRMNAKC